MIIPIWSTKATRISSPVTSWSHPLADQRTGEDRVLTLPNAVSLVRILAVPVFVWLLLGADQIAAAGWLLLAIGSTDWLDGWLARRLGQVSKVGRMLDPVADRLAIVAAVIAGWLAEILPGWLVVGLLVREAVVGGLAIWLFLRHRRTIDVRRLGKLATLLLYGAIPAFYVAAAGVAEPVLRPVAVVSGFVGLLFYWLVGVSYGSDVRQAARNSIGSDPTIEKGFHERS